MKGTIVLLICIGLSGCSLFNLTRNCEGEGCNQTPAVGNPEGEPTWYCYAAPDAKEWSCQDEKDPSRILSLKQVGLKKVAPRFPMLSLMRKVTHGPQHMRGKQALPDPVRAQQSGQQQSVGQPIEAQRVTPLQQVARATPPRRLELQPSSTGNAQINQGATSILQQPAGFYAVQLIALQSERQILNYARDNGLKYPLYAQIQSQGRTLYVLLLGCYPDRLSAARAKDEWGITKKLTSKPWIRDLGSLQDAIRLAVR